MIAIVTSPVGGCGVSTTAALLALWLREVTGQVRLIDVSPSSHYSPLVPLGAIPRLELVRAASAQRATEDADPERAFANAWLHAQRAMECADPATATVIDLPQVFSAWAWGDIMRWVVAGDDQVDVMLLLPPSAQSRQCLARRWMSVQTRPQAKIAESLILAYPGWEQGSRMVLRNEEARAKLVHAGARELDLYSLAWGTSNDAISSGIVPVGLHRNESFFGRRQLRHRLTEYAKAFGELWPSKTAGAVEKYADEWTT